MAGAALALLVSASAHDFSDPTAAAWTQRTDAMEKAVRAAPPATALIVAPAGYWTVAAEDLVPAALRSLSARLKAALRCRNCTLVAGIDALPPTKTTRTVPRLVATYSLRSWGFAITSQGHIVGPWRQISTTNDNAALAPSAVYETLRERVLRVRRERVMPLVCGEMHNEHVRQQIAALGPSVVAVSGHRSLGRGLVPSLHAVRARVIAAGQPASLGLHAQHLVRYTRANVHWVDRGGVEHAAPARPAAARDPFWLHGTPVSLES